ncbi:MAG: hypothetical protein E7337_12675 [Clostridiales bacterium]|nr:hypothetical protein [Clostridiales bacterium]
MKSMKRSILKRIEALLLAVCLITAGMPACAQEIATDLFGGLVGVPEGSADSIEAQSVVPDMNSADLVMGYVSGDNPKLSPLTCNEQNLISLNQLIYEPVVELDGSMKPSPMLADSWTRSGKNWIFRLRSGITFHNGYELTAYDVVQSYEAILKAGSACPYYGRVSSLISDMQATDTLTLTVKAKYSGLVTLYGMTFPVMQYSTVNDAVPRGTGPYWFIQYDGDGTIRLEANALWWKKQPNIKSIIAKRYSDISYALEALELKDIETLATKSTKAAISRKLADLTSMDYVTLTYEMLVPNLSKKSIMSDLNVRKAVMYAIDRAIIASNAYVDMAIQCEVPVQPSSWLYESQSAVYYYSPERALQLMQNSGWQDLNSTGILSKLDGIMINEAQIDIITYNDSTSSVRENAANLIAGYLNTIGINTTVTVVSKSRCKERMADKEYDLALIGVNLSEVPNLYAILNSDGNLNFNNHKSDGLDALLSSAAAATTEADLKLIYSEIQLDVVERLPIMGLMFRTGTVLSRRSLAGLTGLRAFDTYNGIEFMQ